MLQDDHMENHALARLQARLEAERSFINEQGGQPWLEMYVTPFYLKWMNCGATKADAHRLIPALRERAAELSAAEISLMLGMQWRIQVVGAWYAIAQADNSLSGPLHSAFEDCNGSLTAPAFLTAVMTYPNESTAAAITAYRERALAGRYGGTDLMTAALVQLGEVPGDRNATPENDLLDELLDVARQLQASG